MTSNPGVSEMVERCALGVYAYLAAQSPTQGETWENIYPEAREQIRCIARAAIEAMAEPTEAMVMAGYEADNGCHADEYPRPNGVKNIYRAAIDAALNPPETDHVVT
jgi:hypothetical protein